MIRLSDHAKRSLVSGSFATTCSAEAEQAKAKEGQGAWLWYCARDFKGHAAGAAQHYLVKVTGERKVAVSVKVVRVTRCSSGQESIVASVGNKITTQVEVDYVVAINRTPVKIEGAAQPGNCDRGLRRSVRLWG